MRGLPFIPAWLDEQPVSPHAFRVLAHLWRRADISKGPPWSCYPGTKSMAAACRMKRDTVFKALRELEAAGLLSRQPQLGRGNLYRLTCPEKGGTPQSGTPHLEQPADPSPETGQHPSPKAGQGVSPETGQGVSRKGGHKGTPCKVPQGKVPQGEGGCAPTPAPPSDGQIGFPYSSWADAPQEIRSGVSQWRFPNGGTPDAAFWALTFDRLRGRKLTYHDRHTPADWPAVVLAEMDAAAHKAGLSRPAVATRKGDEIIWTNAPRSWQPDPNDEEAY